MKKMTISEFAPDYSYRQCVSAMKSEAERSKMLAQVDNIKNAAIDFLEHSKAGTTSSIPPIRIAKGDNPSVVGDITKAEMVKLYEYYMVKREPGRSIYNAILMSAEESCPLCGGDWLRQNTRSLFTQGKLPAAHSSTLQPCSGLQGLQYRKRQSHHHRSC